ncbi:hypothetical protein [Ferrimicrobium sp.]|uniref:hypothetical protein n=1 Tax=Ferrimicrobium sp. TaxID=2926050 RepID=UPI0026138A29|nr:hypothetical protein [Ferrimicrobium sp.]
MPAKEARQASRQISLRRLETQIMEAQADSVTDVALTKIDSLTTATGNAMAQITRVTQLQRQLEMMAPDAAARLAFIADDHALGCAELLAELRRDLRRIR